MHAVGTMHINYYTARTESHVYKYSSVTETESTERLYDERLGDWSDENQIGNISLNELLICYQFLQKKKTVDF